MVDMYEKVYFGDKIVDAAEASLSIASSAVLYGLSVYTVLPVSVDAEGQKRAFRLHDHFLRLINSAQIIGIDTFAQHWDFAKFESAIKEVLTANAISQNAYVRVSVHVDEQLAGTRSRGLHTTLSMFVYDAVPILPAEGCRLKTSVWRRIPDFAIPSRAKVNGAYVNSVLAKQDAIDSGYDDCIFLDVQGHVCELSAANIFIVRHGQLITPDATSDILEGINRQTLITLAREDLGLEVIERSIDLTELYVADEVFACGTSANISPVLEIDSRVVADGKVGAITQQLNTIHKNLRMGQYDKARDWLTPM